jgi:hypothetical protein
VIRLVPLVLLAAALAACSKAPPEPGTEPCPDPSATPASTAAAAASATTKNGAASSTVATAASAASSSTMGASVASSIAADPRRGPIAACCTQLGELKLPIKHEGFQVSAMGICRRAFEDPDTYNLGDVRAILDAKKIPHPPACRP